MAKDFDQKFLRVIDANFNRAKEGMRVCEDVCRFWLDDKVLTQKAKACRHQLTEDVKPLGWTTLVAGRDIEADVGKTSSEFESQRSHLVDVFYANCQRVKESLRVLEEFAKLKNPLIAKRLKFLRYQVYGFEKKVLSQKDFIKMAKG